MVILSFIKAEDFVFRSTTTVEILFSMEHLSLLCFQFVIYELTWISDYDIIIWCVVIIIGVTVSLVKIGVWRWGIINSLFLSFLNHYKYISYIWVFVERRLRTSRSGKELKWLSEINLFLEVTKTESEHFIRVLSRA